MRRVDELFHLRRSRSELLSKHRPGPVPYVASGFSDNGVMGWVAPLSGDRVFQFRGVAVSAFCEATVQVPPFIGYGCAGTSIVALEPKEAMTTNQLAYAAAYINLGLRWRFSWYWRAIPSRLGRLLMPDAVPDDLPFDLSGAMPKTTAPEGHGTPRDFILRRFALGDIFDLRAGDYHSVGILPRGAVPIISCGEGDNGVCGYFDVDHSYSHKLTIAFNGMNALNAKFHPYQFAAKDDVAVCFPKAPLRLTTLLFIQMMLKREQWRYSYYRKCFKEKLGRVTIPLPCKGEAIDEDAIESVMHRSPYWGFLRDRLHHESHEEVLAAAR